MWQFNVTARNSSGWLNVYGKIWNKQSYQPGDFVVWQNGKFPEDLGYLNWQKQLETNLATYSGLCKHVPTSRP